MIESPWLTVREAAAYLKVSVRTMKRYTAAGMIPYSRLGEGKGLIRYDQNDLDQHMASRKCAGQTDAPPQAPGYKRKRALPEHRAPDRL